LGIARRYSMSATQLAQANGTTIDDILHPGDRLVIPDIDVGGPPSVPSVSYIVKAGDTLTRIAAATA
jgi:LysM repeat protein